MRKEKVIQFGEGGFLRGFVDWMLQITNEKTDFNGSVVVVQPIKNGMCDMLSAQGCVYTHLCRGVEGVDQKKIDVILTAIWRWHKILISALLFQTQLRQE